MYLPNKEKLHLYWAIDIEGDPIPSTRVWCACAWNIRTREEVRFRDYENLRKWIADRKAEGCKFVAHNGIGYDFYTLNLLVGTKLTISDICDTMLMSMVYSPSLDGGHGLAAWGKRIGHAKTEWDDFSKWSQEQEDYCMNDAILCGKVFIALVNRMRQLGFTEDGLDIEHRSWHLIQKQKRNGFAFNIKEAHILYNKIREKENEIRDRIHEFWPPELRHVATFKKPFKKDGNPSANYTRHQQQYVEVRVREDDGEYDAYDYVYFSIGSPQQRVEKLLELGWEPREFTKGGSPQPTSKGKLSPSLAEFVEKSGNEQVKLIANWIEYNARANMINTWIEAYNDDTGCIHGSLWLANTLRYRHSEPNSANIPAVRLDKEDRVRYGEDGVFTYEARNLWTVRSDDRMLVGVDAKGIQLRVLAHYLNNPEFTEAVLGGDPHSYNQKIGSFATRSIAKTFIYSYLLGAGDAKVGQIIGGSTKDGREVKQLFTNNFPGLKNLLDALERQVDRTGRIVLCDGTPIIVSSPHTRLGYLLQGDESRIMKKAAILADIENRRRALDVLKVGDIHDEWQNDVYKDHTDEFAYEVCPLAFRSSGEHFRYRLPIDCDAKVGLTWASTH
jgi:DNA polymerase-1